MTLSASTPQHALTDAALIVLSVTRRQSAAASRANANSRTRIKLSSPSLGSADPAVINLEGSLLRYVSIAEAYTDARMFELMRGAVDSPSALLERLIEQVEVSVSNSWHSRQEAYSRLYGVELKSIDGWPDLQAAVNVRNAIAHGLGQLTPQLRRRRRLPQQVQRIGVRVGGNRFHLPSSALETVFEACTRYIRGLDAAT